MYKAMFSSQKLYIVLEYCEQDLSEIILKSQGLSEQLAGHYMHQICLGIAALHSHNIAHRDLKPENILLVQHSIRISDFGVSRLVKDSSAITPCGTIFYTAPDIIRVEQAQETQYDALKCDVWSTGIILYVMLTGSFPFYDKCLNKLKLKILSCKFFLPQTISPGAADLLQRILVPYQHDRPSITEVLLHPYFSLLTRCGNESDSGS
ncbi:hypothetical protein P9112_008134 [Eukaryota sp. TZLM1-RC]